MGVSRSINIFALLKVIGGFITGKWFIIANAWVNEAFKTNGYHVVSVGYRLLPHAGLDEMMEDLQDAFQWCLSNLPRICGPKAVALDRYVVGGESAGGTLASICGYKFLPRPKAVFDLYGAVDLADPIYCIWDPVEESSFVPLYLRERKEEDLATALSRRDLRNAEVYGLSDSKLTPSTPFKKIRELWGRDDIDRNEKHYLRTDMNKYMFSRNVLLSTLLRKERFSTKQAYLDECTRWSASLIARKEGTYPPALFLHGADDPLVPLAQSMDFARLLTKLDVPVKEVYAEGEGHCFDYSIAVS